MLAAQESNPFLGFYLLFGFCLFFFLDLSAKMLNALRGEKQLLVKSF